MTIGEVSARTGLSADTLRYYERIGLIPCVPRNGSGVRAYGEDIVEWILFIRRFKGNGISLDLLLDYMRLAMAGSETRHERRAILLKARAELLGKIESLCRSLREADLQIENYESSVLPETESVIAPLRPAVEQSSFAV